MGTRAAEEELRLLAHAAGFIGRPQEYTRPRKGRAARSHVVGRLETNLLFARGRSCVSAGRRTLSNSYTAASLADGRTPWAISWSRWLSSCQANTHRKPSSVIRPLSALPTALVRYWRSSAHRSGLVRTS